MKVKVELYLKAKKSTIITLITLDEAQLDLIQRHLELIWYIHYNKI